MSKSEVGKRKARPDASRTVAANVVCDRFIFGTYRLSGDSLRTNLKNALELGGFRRVDTASRYQNEKDVSSIVRAFLEQNPDDEVVLTTKIAPTDDSITLMTRVDVVDALRRSLAELSPLHPRVKLRVLLHYYVGDAAWPALEAVVSNRSFYPEFDRIEEIGVSNYHGERLTKLIGSAKIKPVVNQIEFHPLHPDALKTLAICVSNKIAVEGHSLLTQSVMLEAERFTKLAAAYERTVAVLLLRWAFQHGVFLCVSSTSAISERLPDWLDVQSDSLIIQQGDMNSLNKMFDDNFVLYDYN